MRRAFKCITDGFIPELIDHFGLEGIFETVASASSWVELARLNRRLKQLKQTIDAEE
jgi:hypothetical protein